ncbi:MAG TPA: hypothetical protein VNF99_17260 [Stellaceae bacterium]|nr:hypothetical protein [Stellaceae bacterium]
MSRRKPRAKPLDELAPSPERRAHGTVERLPHAIADEAGRPVRPYRAVDTLGAMLRKGTITPAMHQAGEEFHALFMTAQLEPLRAADLRRMPDGMHELPMSLRQSEARKAIWRMLKTLGGVASPAGSCLWHVVGCAATLKEWALHHGWNRRALSQEAASGVLIGALGALQALLGL